MYTLMEILISISIPTGNLCVLNCIYIPLIFQIWHIHLYVFWKAKEYWNIHKYNSFMIYVRYIYDIFSQCNLKKRYSIGYKNTLVTNYQYLKCEIFALVDYAYKTSNSFLSLHLLLYLCCNAYSWDGHRKIHVTHK